MQSMAKKTAIGIDLGQVVAAQWRPIWTAAPDTTQRSQQMPKSKPWMMNT
jgi:hypothetical protein